jgi:PAS domain-containing protein
MTTPAQPPAFADQTDAVLVASREVRAVFEHASLGIALTRDRVIIRHNRVFGARLGYQPNQLVGQPATVLFSSSDDYQLFGQQASQFLQQCILHLRWVLPQLRHKALQLLIQRLLCRTFIGYAQRIGCQFQSRYQVFSYQKA